MAHWHRRIFRKSRSRERNIRSDTACLCRRNRSRCPSSKKSIKRRKLVRKILSLRAVENYMREKWNRKWGNSGTKHGSGLLLGGARGRPRRKVGETFNGKKFAEIVAEKLKMGYKSRKNMWQAIAQEYYGEFRVDKKKIRKLRMIWRANKYNVQETVHKKAAGFQGNGTNESCKPDLFVNPPKAKVGDEEVGEKILHNYICNSESNSGKCTLSDFFGNVVGRALSYVYKDHIRDSDYSCGTDNLHTNELHESKFIHSEESLRRPSEIQAESNDSKRSERNKSDVNSTFTTDFRETRKRYSSTDSSADEEKPENYVYHVDKDQCQCYNTFYEEEKEHVISNSQISVST